jgi:hypothetical protein
MKIFRNFVEKIQIWLKSDKNNSYFTLRHMYIYGNMLLSSSKIEKFFIQIL